MSTSARALILITGLSLTAGCLSPSNAAAPGSAPTAAPTKPEPRVYRNPPRPQPMPRRPATQGPVDKTAPAGSMDTPLTETLPSGQQIYASGRGGCYTPYPTTDAKLPDIPDFQTEVACPESMLKREWGHCTGIATLYSDTAGEVCTCAPAGDPPPAPFGVPCPK